LENFCNKKLWVIFLLLSLPHSYILGIINTPVIQAPADQVIPQKQPIDRSWYLEGTIKIPACRPLWNI
jgi:hypothetical protein